MASNTVPKVSPGTTPMVSPRRGPVGGRFWRRNATGWGLVLPYVVYFCLFTAFPIGFAIYLTFYRWNNLAAPPIPNGLHNYQYLINDANFWNALKVTLIFAVVFVVVMIPLALTLALALNRSIPGRSFFRAAFFMPYITPGVVVAIVFIWIWQTQNGILNNLLGFVGIPPVPWLTSAKLAMPAIALTAVWKQAGYFTVIFLAGLQGIPRQIYEAAAVDGATAWTQFRRITLPLLGPYFELAVLLGMIYILQLFGEIFVATQGGPGTETTTIPYYVYQTISQANDVGTSSAQGVLAIIFSAIIAALLLRLLTRTFRRGLTA